MMRRLTIASAVLGAALFTQATRLSGQQGQQAPVFRGESDTVPVYVTVTDKDDRLVTNLTKDDFQLFDNGKPQPISLFDNTPRPIRLIVMLDVSGSMDGNLPLLRAASDELFTRLGPQDRVRVGSFGKSVDISPAFTRNVVELRAALPAVIEPGAPTPLWLATQQAIGTFGEDDQRRVVLVLSDGKDSGFIPQGVKVGDKSVRRLVTQLEIIEDARKQTVMIYGVGLRSQPQPGGYGTGAAGLSAMMGDALPDPGLARTAIESGGGYLEITRRDDLGAAFARVADELHSQYLLGFTPTQRDGKVHKVEVKLVPKNMKSRARKEYVAPK